MASYYVNIKAQLNGDHEVHKADCRYLPDPINREYLGEFPSCHGEVKRAKEIYPTADGCAICSTTCHTR